MDSDQPEIPVIMGKILVDPFFHVQNQKFVVRTWKFDVGTWKFDVKSEIGSILDQQLWRKYTFDLKKLKSTILGSKNPFARGGSRASVDPPLF